MTEKPSKPRKAATRRAPSKQGNTTAASTTKQKVMPVPEEFLPATEPSEGFDTFARDLLTFLGHFERHNARRIATGGVAKKTRQKIAPWLRRRDDDYASFLAIFLIDRRVLFEGEQHWEISRPRLGRLWTPEKLLRSAFHFWMRTPLWNESLDNPDVLSFVRREYLSSDPTLESRRRRLSEELASTVRDGGDTIDLKTLVTGLDRSFQPGPRLAEGHRTGPYSGRMTPAGALSRMLHGPLSWFGMLESTSHGQSHSEEFKITPLGKLTLLEDWDGITKALGNMIFDPAAKITTQPNLEVLAPPNLDPSAYLNLARLADLQSVDIYTTFTITWDSLMNALDRGSTAKQVLGFMTSTNATPLPDTLRQLIDDCHGRHGEIRLGVAGHYIEVREASLLPELEANPRFDPWIQRTIGEHVALLVPSVDITLLTRELRSAGYSVSLTGGEKIQMRTSGAQISVSHPELEELYAAVRATTKLAAEVDPDFDLSALESLKETLALELTRQEDSGGQIRARELEGLVAQLLQAHVHRVKEEPVLEEAKDLDEIRALLETAIERKIPIEIEYDGFQGVTHRVIDASSFDGRYVTGFCRLREDQRVFNSARILSARLVPDS